MNSPTKSEIDLALKTEYEEPRIASVLIDAYLETVEILREIMSVELGWQAGDDRTSYIDIQVDKSTLEKTKAILEKAPEVKDE